MKWTVILIGVGLLIPLAGSAQEDSESLSRVSLDEAIVFSAPDGSPVEVTAGTYAVENTATGDLQIVATDGDDEDKDALAIAKERGNTQVIEIPSAGMVQEQVVPPLFDEPGIEVAGSDDAEILEAVDAAVSVAENHGFQYDASDSENGRVVVKALWKGRPVTLTMRFFRKESGLYIASAMEQPGDVFLSGGGKKIEQIFYPDLLQETTRRGLTIYGDPQATP